MKPCKTALTSLLLSFLIVACGTDEGDAELVCQPGKTSECMCGPGSPGIQVCKDDGSGWGECEQCCTPDCAGKECGPDGCGGSCGECVAGFTCTGETCVEGGCVPECTGIECGSDGCDGSCGDCPDGQTCKEGKCKEDGPCVPNCTGMECGDDGCSGSCGDCQPDEECVAGTCKATGPVCDCGDGTCETACPSETTCNCPEDCGKDCGDGCCHELENFESCPDDCKGCGDGTCQGNEDCTKCPADCACDGGQKCSSGECISCTAWCQIGGYECGDKSGCDCGGCGQNEICEANKCEDDCDALCEDKECDPIPNTVCDCGDCTGCASDCNNNQCEATHDVPPVCDGDDVYQNDSCGENGQFVESCEYGCAGGICLEPGCGDICIPGVCGEDFQGCNCGDCEWGQKCNQVTNTCEPDCDVLCQPPKECGQVDGTDCDCGGCDDGLACTTDTCPDSTCHHDLQNNYCKIAGDCVGSGFENPQEPCWKCKPAQAKYDWTELEDGAPCGSGKKCYQGACCFFATNCFGKECGPDGCGGVCGTCDGPQDECVVDQCVCQPACQDKNCGSDGCGGTCGACGQNEECGDGVCYCQGGSVACDGSCCESEDVCYQDSCCSPDCAGKECGTDGCGAKCGSCGAYEECSVNGECQCKVGYPQCGDVCCWKWKVCFEGGCCLPNCPWGTECGDDGCGGGCGTCDASQEECVAGKCKCQPACQGKDCGDDGCGGTCGNCGYQSQCIQSTCVCQPYCAGKDCGDDGCGGSCGDCPSWSSCVDYSCSCNDDVFEYNDTKAKSTLIQPGSYFNLTSCPGQWDYSSNDYYHLYSEKGDTIVASVDFAHEEGNIDLGIVNPDNFLVEKSATLDDHESVSLLVDEPGKYWIKVYLEEDLGDVPGNSYEMQVQHVECVPSCGGKECGADGCLGSCGYCSANSFCTNGGICQCEELFECGGTCCGSGEICYQQSCCALDCSGKDCGEDGCGGQCGECDDIFYCLDSQCIYSYPTWFDSASGLEWQVETSEDTMIWSNADSHCKALLLDGSGWRLPTIGELRTLVRGCPATETGGSCNVEEGDCLKEDCGNLSCLGCSSEQGPSDGCYWPDMFQGTCSLHWSSSPVVYGGSMHWGIVFTKGKVGYGSNYGLGRSLCVR